MVKEDYKPIKPAKIGFAQKILLGIAALGLAGTVAYSLIDNYRNRTEVEFEKDYSKFEVTFDKYTNGDLQRRVFTQHKKCSDRIHGVQYGRPLTIGGERLYSTDNLGDLLEVRNGKLKYFSEKSASYYDFDCDKKMDLIKFNKLFEEVNRFEGEPELFKKANEELAKFKKDIKEHMDLEKVTKEWLGEK
ncbi:MAG: hypothetical protein KKB39_01645 [Nanoarchaeota archaeon]|nr:hypothetical protein [Nanoarchaeota archaeon]